MGAECQVGLRSERDQLLLLSAVATLEGLGLRADMIGRLGWRIAWKLG